jgi:predicted acylesterase/phospholipase RssA
MRKHLRRLCPSIPALCVLLAPSLVAGQPPDDPSATERPRVGLVLGGGGARGAAHIGVLKELERLRVPIDAIAGTSMGAIVGGLYASGRSATELEELVASLDWAVALSDESNRENLSFRRKQDEREVPIDFNVGIQGTDIVLPKGAIQGQKLDLLLRDLTKDVSHVHDYDDLPIPFRAIASDIEHGEPWVMGEGDLARSIRASMSVPAVFAPVVVDGRLLADGGLVGNLPIEVMRDMDVDVIIAVDVAFPLYSRDELDSALTISEQIVTILIGKETRRQVELLGAGDILIRPELGQFSSSDFGSITNAVEPGAQATRSRTSRSIPPPGSATPPHAVARAPAKPLSHLCGSYTTAPSRPMCSKRGSPLPQATRSITKCLRATPISSSGCRYTNRSVTGSSRNRAALVSSSRRAAAPGRPAGCASAWCWRTTSKVRPLSTCPCA